MDLPSTIRVLGYLFLLDHPKKKKKKKTQKKWLACSALDTAAAAATVPSHPTPESLPPRVQWSSKPTTGGEQGGGWLHRQRRCDQLRPSTRRLHPGPATRAAAGRLPQRACGVGLHPPGLAAPPQGSSPVVIRSAGSRTAPAWLCRALGAEQPRASTELGEGKIALHG